MPRVRPFSRLHRLSNRNSPLLHTSLITRALRDPAFWDDLLAIGPGLGRRRWRKLGLYRGLLLSGEVRERVELYAAGDLAMAPPLRRQVNKANGRKKTIFTFAPADELILKALNRVLQPICAADHSRLCHSFQPGRGPRTAFASLLAIPGLRNLHCLHLDIRDYFNSIPPERLLQSLPSSITDDRILLALLTAILLDSRVRSDGRIVIDEHRGVMAGTPLAPLLSNLYLRSLDAEFESPPSHYLRYADDIVVFGDAAQVDHARSTIERHLHGLGLELNPAKTRLSPPGAPWEFLGLRYEAGRLNLADNTAAKARRRVRRVARRARSRPDPKRYAIARLNRRFYGVGGMANDFTWAEWFFPLLTSDSALRSLDRVVQEQLRYAVTGRHSRRNLAEVPYAALVAAGYLPLASAYHAFRHRRSSFDDMVLGRSAGLSVTTADGSGI